ncbi:Subunit of heteropentameric Replication factor C (RF-C) [Savitreella phatthalungensis]
MFRKKNGGEKGGSGVQPSAPESAIWVEKYRPKSLDQVASQEHTVQVLKKTLAHANMPHMLFYGPPGTGKTSTILALAKDLFGPEMVKSRVLELNASDERGISIVREKVKNFAKATVTADRTGGEYPCPAYKIIVLDEADSMTQDAQAALRRTMETYSRITRFCLVCNYVTRIIEPLASRCSKFRFKPLDQNDTAARLTHIAREESLTMEDGAVEELVRCSEGDLRRAITYLQSAARLVGGHAGRLTTTAGDGDGEDAEMLDVDGDAVRQSTTITKASIIAIAGLIDPTVITTLFDVCIDRDRLKFQQVDGAVRSLVREGYSAGQILSQLHDTVVSSEEVDPKSKNAILLLFSEADKKLNDGASEHLQLFNLVCGVRTILAH